jgi:hypothetical protein
MKASTGSARRPGKAKAKAKSATSAPKPASKAKKAKATAKPKPPASAAKASKARQGPTVAADTSVSRRGRDAGGWREETLARMRALILEAEPQMSEERKWAKAANPLGVPVWSHHGIVCTGETYKNSVKLTFARGASLADPSRLFNSSLEGNTRRAIDIHEGEKIDAGAFKALVKAAVAQNAASAKKR